MKRIDLEAHFYTRDFAQHLRARKAPPREEVTPKYIRVWLTPDVYMARTPAFEERLIDLGTRRLEEMDAAGIDIQVLSISQSCEQFEPDEGTEWAKRTNDELAAVIEKYPDRFIGLAAVAPQDPGEAAKELERCVKELGFRGACIHSNVGGEYLDNEKFRIILETAESLGIPINIHPTTPSSDMLKSFSGYGYALAGTPWGFGADTALCAMRLIYSGAFDRFPGLKIILGHLGESLPFWLNRIDWLWLRPWVDTSILPKIARKPSDYIKSNFIITTSGMVYPPAFICTYLALGSDNMAFATDYPYEDSRHTVQSMDAMPICEADREKIYHLNAERLFKIG